MTRHIESRENPIYKRLVRLASSARARREQSAALLDGPHLIEAFRASGGTVDTVVASESGYARDALRSLFDDTPAQTRVILADRLFDDIAQVVTPAGILAVIHTPEPEALPTREETTLFLDGIQDPGNLGSIFRTAAAAGVSRIFLSKGCVFAWSPKVLRAGQGAHFYLSIHQHAPLTAMVGEFRGMVIVTDPRAQRTVFDVDLSGPVAWIFGGEGHGVSAELAARATLRVRVPMTAGAESLNVAAAAAVCLFEQVRQRARKR